MQIVSNKTYISDILSFSLDNVILYLFIYAIIKNSPKLKKTYYFSIL